MPIWIHFPQNMRLLALIYNSIFSLRALLTLIEISIRITTKHRNFLCGPFWLQMWDVLTFESWSVLAMDFYDNGWFWQWTVLTMDRFDWHPTWSCCTKLHVHVISHLCVLVDLLRIFQTLLSNMLFLFFTH